MGNSALLIADDTLEVLLYEVKEKFLRYDSKLHQMEHLIDLVRNEGKLDASSVTLDLYRYATKEEDSVAGTNGTLL